MSKTAWNRYFIGLAVITSLALLVWIAGAKARAQNTSTKNAISGDWTATVSNKDNSKIQLNLERRSERGGKHQHGQSYEFSDLQGLSREQALNGGQVSFSLVREAGKTDFEGSFQNGKGSGTFRFTANPAFASAMKSRGFDFEQNSDDDERHPEERIFTAAMLNVTTALADDLMSAGFPNLRVEDLFKAAIFKVNSAFMREMKASGFNNLGMEELVKARIFKIDADFVRQVSQMGFDKEPFESLVKMQIFKVTPEFITEVRNEGLTNLQVEDIVKLRIFKIDAEFIRKAKADGVPVDVESLVQKRIGVARR
jgi:hypothetical protein